jgi:hypothetical protein
MWSRVSWRRQSATSESILSPETIPVSGGEEVETVFGPSSTGEREAGADSGTRSRARPERGPLRRTYGATQRDSATSPRPPGRVVFSA